jgi:hypothetical protein
MHIMLLSYRIVTPHEYLLFLFVLEAYVHKYNKTE